MPDNLQDTLKSIILSHLSRLDQYRPAHGRGPNKLTAAELRQALANDPVYSIFGLDSPEYIAAALSGGTITSIHRKIGDAYEECVRTIFVAQFHYRTLFDRTRINTDSFSFFVSSRPGGQNICGTTRRQARKNPGKVRVIPC